MKISLRYFIVCLSPVWVITLWENLFIEVVGAIVGRAKCNLDDQIDSGDASGLEVKASVVATVTTAFVGRRLCFALAVDG